MRKSKGSALASHDTVIFEAENRTEGFQNCLAMHLKFLESTVELWSTIFLSFKIEPPVLAIVLIVAIEDYILFCKDNKTFRDQ